MAVRRSKHSAWERNKKNTTPSRKLGSSVKVSESKALYVPSETALGRDGPFGAALVTGARHSPGVSSQVGTQLSPARALFAFAQVDGTGRSGPAAACPMGVALWSPLETRSLRPFWPDVRQPAIWLSANGVLLSYGGGAASVAPADIDNFCRRGPQAPEDLIGDSDAPRTAYMDEVERGRPGPND